jgi:hypothetical protein
MQSKQITLGDLYKMIVELKDEMSGQESATQKAISSLRKDLNQAFELFKSHKCWISE